MPLLKLDEQLTNWLYQAQLSQIWQQGIYVLAGSFIYLLPLAIIVLFFRSQRDRLFSAKLVLGTLLTWQVLSKLIGTILYTNYGFRDRPFASNGIQEFFFERPEKAFPSDHAGVFAVVIALCFLNGYKKLAYFFLTIGVISSLSRVIIGFHWFGDVIGGWLLGILVALLMQYFDRPLSRLWQFLENGVSRMVTRR